MAAGINRRFPVHRLRKQQNPASWTRRIHGSPDQAVAADRQNHCIGATAFGQLAHRLDHIGTRSINASAQTETFRYCKPLGIQIGSNYPWPRSVWPIRSI